MFVRRRQWCGCVIRVEKGRDSLFGRVVEFCGVPHRDPRNDPGYPQFVPLPKPKLKVRKARRA